uniref:Heptosyltransferase family protein n=1 Tax=uncultured bacterium UPO57 TaxID=1776980 RepID=A0A126SYK2_9BACT|nr:heptosyltransferase family protein [uncultured bacterium UPO57]
MFGRKSENILIIKTDGLAAFVAAEPVFAEIRKANPDAKISLLTQAGLARIARAAPYFDQVAAAPDFREAEARKAFVRQLKSARFTRVFDLSADEAARKLHASMGPFRPKWHAVEAAPRRRKEKAAAAAAAQFDRLLAEAGLSAPARLPDFHWALSARKDSANMQPAWFGVSGAFGLLLPGGDPARRWPASNYAELARLMARAHIMPVMAGGKELHAFGDEIAHLAPEIVDLAGKTDHLQLAALAQEAAFFVSDDAEEMHLAVSVGCAGVIIRKAAEAHSAPAGRHVVTLTAKADLGEAAADFVWRTLDNMGLIPDKRRTAGAAAPSAAAR